MDESRWARKVFELQAPGKRKLGKTHIFCKLIRIILLILDIKNKNMQKIDGGGFYGREFVCSDWQIGYYLDAESSQSLQQELLIAWLRSYLVPKTTTLDEKIKIYSLEGAICAFQKYFNPIILSGVLPELLFNKFIRVLFITMWLCVKGRYGVPCNVYFLIFWNTKLFWKSFCTWLPKKILCESLVFLDFSYHKCFTTQHHEIMG